MYSIVNYVIKIFTNYSNFNDFFIHEIPLEITKFDFFNFLFLIFIFLFLVFKYLFKTYGSFFIIKLIITRIFIVSLFFFVIYLGSDMVYCETEVNKLLKSFIDTENKKTMVKIVLFCGIGYASYKVIPAIYKNLKESRENYLALKTKYDLDIIKRKEISKKYIDYQMNDLKYIMGSDYKNSIEKSANFQKETIKFNQNLMEFFSLWNVNVQKFDCIYNKEDIPKINSFYFDFVTRLNLKEQLTFDFQFHTYQLDRILYFYYNIGKKFIEIGKEKGIYNINFREIHRDHVFIVKNMKIIIDIYAETLGPLQVKLVALSKKDKVLHKEEYDFVLSRVQGTLDYVSALTNSVEDRVNKLTEYSLTLQNLPVIKDSSINFEPILNVDKLKDELSLKAQLAIVPVSPVPPSTISNISLTVLEASANVSYTILYPFFYCTTKIIGTYPLTYKAFKDLVKFFNPF